MARLPSSGLRLVMYVWPEELQAALADLELKPLDPECEQEVLLWLNLAIGAWWGQYKFQDKLTARKEFAKPGIPYGYEHAVDSPGISAGTVSGAADAPASEPANFVTVEDVAGRLSKLADCLETVDEALELPGIGLHTLDFAKLETIGYLSKCLDVGATDDFPASAARAYLAELRERAGVVARACRQAQAQVETHRGRRGPAPYDWFDGIAAVVMELCEQNGIKATISTDRITNEKGGRFLEVAERIVQILPPAMRPSSRGAIAQRLARSRKRLREGDAVG